MKRYSNDTVRIAAELGWYELFSRGARDWLRHNEKIRDAVEEALPNLIAGPDILTGSSSNTVAVPVRLLEHARFRLMDPEHESGAGQGAGEVGQVLRPGGTPGGDPQSGSKGGSGQGELTFVVELKIDDLMDWLWEEMRLPELKPKRSPAIDESDLVREGWDKRGARSRLDRRRTVKEAVKRRAIQESPAPFTDDDLRFRQIVARHRPAVNAAVIFALDVSGSMGETERQLAKSFFFFALQGIRRQYAKVETAFLAHAAEAWEFNEAEFFQTSGTGGTVTSSVLALSLDLLKARYDPAHYNVYLFYASDGDNYSDDREKSAEALRALAAQLNYAGYVEIRPSYGITAETEMGAVFGEVQREHRTMGMARVTGREDIWNALRAFFQQQADAAKSA
jgi:sporulation protein YhbH